MTLEFFAVNVVKRIDDRYNISTSIEQLIQKMEALNIKKAVVYHILQRDGHPEPGNETLIKEILYRPELYGILTVLPFQTDEIKKFNFKELKDKKIVGFNFFPKKHNYLLNRATLGNFLSEIEDRCFPVFLDVMSGFSVGWNETYSLLDDFPKLVCILCNLGIWNTDRYTWPLLERFPNVYLESSFLSLNEGSLEETVKRFGAERIVFGSGYPERYMEASILQIVHSEIEEQEKRNIAYRNIERIIKDIKYE
ncbi:MAG: amidohydrolase [Candidatus Omnitrophica bacterium]|nr:amidohydrolase [Candidatus Omnitrophota bacterium]